MLIAMVWDIYQRVRGTECDHFLKGRAELIIEVETLMTKATQDHFASLPPYLHQLTKAQRNMRENAG
jgi:hypothetical protein